MYLTPLAVTVLIARAVIPYPPGHVRQQVDSVKLARLEAIWNDAHRRGDADALEQLWAPELMVTVPKMIPMSRPEVLKFFRSGQIVFRRYETSDLRIQIFGDAAVVTGRLQRTREINGRDVDDD